MSNNESIRTFATRDEARKEARKMKGWKVRIVEVDMMDGTRYVIRAGAGSLCVDGYVR